MSHHEVIVGNIGTVVSGSDRAQAAQAYDEYVRQAKAQYGRAAGEPVTWLVDGEIIREHLPRSPVQHRTQRRPRNR